MGIFQFLFLLKIKQLGIIEFLLLSAIVLFYVVIVGGLIARILARRADEIKKHNIPKPDEVEAVEAMI